MDKIDRLLDAIEHPELNTTSEIEEMLRDTDVKETFDLLDKTKSSLQTIITPDIEEEWNKFKDNHKSGTDSSHFRLKGMFSWKAAASIAVGIVSLTAVAAFVSIGLNYTNNQEKTPSPTVIKTETDATVCLQDSVKTVHEEKSVPTEIIVFENDSLESIISEIAAYYGYKAVFNREKAKSLRLYFRWDQSLSIEKVAERLNNFEQINITINDKTIKIN